MTTTVGEIQLRRGSAAAWTTANPVLGDGEPGFEHDTGKFKVGDGVTAWDGLPYFVAGGPQGFVASGPGGTPGGNTGAAVTIGNPNSFSVWWAVANANTTVTLPTPVAGASIIARIDQDATGGRTVTFAGSPPVTVPDAAVNWKTAAHAENWLEFFCPDGVHWEVFPITGLGGGAGGPANWRKEILPYYGGVTTGGVWTIAADSQSIGGGYRQSSGADGDSLAFDIELAAGTWDVYVLAPVGANRGLVDVALDGVVVAAGLDQYNASTGYNTVQKITGVAVAASGKHTLKFTANGHNASSSGFFILLSMITMQRTA